VELGTLGQRDAAHEVHESKLVRPSLHLCLTLLVNCVQTLHGSMACHFDRGMKRKTPLDTRQSAELPIAQATLLWHSSDVMLFHALVCTGQLADRRQQMKNGKPKQYRLAHSQDKLGQVHHRFVCIYYMINGRNDVLFRFQSIVAHLRWNTAGIGLMLMLKTIIPCPMPESTVWLLHCMSG
jgi:hypothetical protein